MSTSKQAGTLVADSQPSYSSIRQVLARTYRNEGFRGFYKGLGTNLIRIAPGASLTLLVYERMSVRAIPKNSHDGSELTDFWPRQIDHAAQTS